MINNVRGFIRKLSQDGTELFRKDSHESGHDIFRILVSKCLFRILKNETQGILLLVFRDLVPSVDIEQRNALEKFLSGLECTLVKV